MKRCPVCRRDYADETLNFCLDDGSALLDGPASMDEPATAVFGVPPSGGTYSNERTHVFGSEPTEGGAQNRNSIAVLPFVNVSPDPDNEYFCDGLAEELLNALSKIDKLKVAARTSAFSFKAKNVSVGEIGEKLGVEKVLE
nr:hypothetical protein [Blastocatellia bacterium]